MKYCTAPKTHIAPEKRSSPRRILYLPTINCQGTSWLWGGENSSYNTYNYVLKCSEYIVTWIYHSSIVTPFWRLNSSYFKFCTPPHIDAPHVARLAHKWVWI